VNRKSHFDISQVIITADRDGLISVPDRPGLGVTLNAAFVIGITRRSQSDL
jgi:L-alanine-DL-glutamate epimerase-like enolase superfamily enzyme